MDDEYHVPMKSWGMSVSATNMNAVDNIFRSKYQIEKKFYVVFEIKP